MQYSYFMVLACIVSALVGSLLQQLLRNKLARLILLLVLSHLLVILVGAVLFVYYLAAPYVPFALGKLAQGVAKAQQKMWEWRKANQLEKSDEHVTALHQPAAEATMSHAMILSVPITTLTFYGPQPLKALEDIPALILGRYSIHDILAAYAHTYYPIFSLRHISIDISIGSEILYSAHIGGAIHSTLALTGKNAHYTDTPRRLTSTLTPTSSVVDDSEDGDVTLVDIDTTLCEQLQSKTDVQEKPLLYIDTTSSPEYTLKSPIDIKDLSLGNPVAVPLTSTSTAKPLDPRKPVFIPARSRLLASALAPIRAVTPSSLTKNTRAVVAEAPSQPQSQQPKVAKVTSAQLVSKARSSLVNLTKKANAAAPWSRKTNSASSLPQSTPALGATSAAPSDSADHSKRKRGGRRIPMPIRRQRRREREAAAKAAAL